MVLKTDLLELKKRIENNKGSKVQLETNKGKQKANIEEGVLADVYPSIFTIQLFEGKEPSRKIAYSYVDVLTNTVELTLCE